MKLIKAKFVGRGPFKVVDIALNDGVGCGVHGGVKGGTTTIASEKERKMNRKDIGNDTNRRQRGIVVVGGGEIDGTTHRENGATTRVPRGVSSIENNRTMMNQMIGQQRDEFVVTRGAGATRAKVFAREFDVVRKVLSSKSGFSTT